MIVGTFKFEANAWLGWSNLYLVKLFARVRSNGGRAKLVSMLLSTAQHEVRLKFLRLVSICSCWWITVRIHVLGPNNVCLHSSHHKTILQYIFSLSLFLSLSLSFVRCSWWLYAGGHCWWNESQHNFLANFIMGDAIVFSLKKKKKHSQHCFAIVANAFSNYEHSWSSYTAIDA